MSDVSSREVDRLERIVGYVLKAGSASSTVIIATGLLLALFVPSVGASQSIIRAGLIVLLLTPVARVVASVFEYSRDRDWLFASLTLIVLLIVLASLFMGIRL